MNSGYPPKEEFFVPSSEHETTIKEKGSKFIAVVFPVSSAEEAETRLNAVRERYPGATHYCYAYILSSGIHRSSDAGEPSGTAGLPILNAVDSGGFRNTLAVVTRYFGGTKLGIGGLKRAYGAAARGCLKSAEKTTMYPTAVIEFSYPYELTGEIESLTSSKDITVKEQQYGERVSCKIEVRKSRKEETLAHIRNATSGRVRIKN